MIAAACIPFECVPLFGTANMFSIDQMYAIRRALASDELDTARAVATEIEPGDLYYIFERVPQVWWNGLPGGWPALRPTVEHFAAVKGDRELSKTVWGRFVEIFALTPDCRAFFTDYAAELDTLDWPKLVTRALKTYGARGRDWNDFLQAYLQGRGRGLLESVPIAAFTNARRPEDILIACINNTLGAPAVQWFARAVVQYMLQPKIAKVRIKYASELLDAITCLYPQIAFDVRVALR